MYPGCSREFHVRDAVAVNTSEAAADKTGQTSVLKHREDPGVIDTLKYSGEANQENTESVMQLISFCNCCILPLSSRTVSSSSINFLLEIVSNVEP